MTRGVAFSINFDSLGAAYGYPEGFVDPTFPEAGEHFLRLADEYGLKYTVFVVGRDLEISGNREVIREFARRGHEIANHSWSHPMNIGALAPDVMRRQIRRAHDILMDVTGEAPTGFTAPNWSASSALIKALIECGYDYDCSAFPSWIMLPAIAKLVLNHLGDRRLGEVLDRRDLGYVLTGAREPFWSTGILKSHGAGATQPVPGLCVLPVPTTKQRIACWHTMSFILGQRRHAEILRASVNSSNCFYYVVHPADLISPVVVNSRKRARVERLGVPATEKEGHLRRAIEIILESGRPVISLREMARAWVGDRNGLGSPTARPHQAPLI